MQSMALKDLSYLVFDLETTGINIAHDRIHTCLVAEIATARMMKECDLCGCLLQAMVPMEDRTGMSTFALSRLIKYLTCAGEGNRAKC